MIQLLRENSVVILEINVQEMKDAEDFLNIFQKECGEGNFNFLIDLKEVSHISSFVLGTFVTSFRNVKSKDGNLKFVNVQPCVSNVFEMTRLNRIFEFFNDRDTAIKSFDTIS